MFDEKWALKLAVEEAKKSKCQSKRGVIIWSRNVGLISCGHNAPPLPFICDGSDQCRLNCAKTAIHAEQSALMKLVHYPTIISNAGGIGKCEMIHVKIIDDEAVFSEKPSCWQCSKLILESGLKSMWLYQKEGYVEYSPREFHLQTLKNCNL